MTPTRKAFIHRLRLMIRKADRNGVKLCGMCPGAINFDYNNTPRAGLEEGYWCKECQESIGLSYFYNADCPCQRMKPKLAEKKARKLIKES